MRDYDWFCFGLMLLNFLVIYFKVWEFWFCEKVFLSSDGKPFCSSTQSLKTTDFLLLDVLVCIPNYVQKLNIQLIIRFCSKIFPFLIKIHYYTQKPSTKSLISLKKIKKIRIQVHKTSSKYHAPSTSRSMINVERKRKDRHQKSHLYVIW